jgi:MFS family permease
MWLINLITLLFSILFQGLSTIVSQYAVIEFYATPLEVGLVWSSFYVASIVIRPLAGLAFDQGYRFRLLIISAILFFISTIAYFFASSIAFLIIARLFQGLGQGIFLTSSFSLVVFEASEHMKYFQESISWRSTMLGLGVTIGPALGGYMISFYGFHTTFLLVITLSALVPVMIWLVTKFTHVNERLFAFNMKFGSRSNPKKNMKTILSDFMKLLFKIESFRAAIISLFLYSLGYTTITSLLPAYYANEWGKEAGVVVGNVLAIIGLSSILPRFFAGTIAKYLSAKNVARFGLLTLAISLALLGVYPFPPLIYIFSIFVGMSLGFVIPSLQIMALTDVSKSEKGVATGLYVIGFDASNLVSPILFGSLANIFGYKFILQIAFLPVLIATIYLLKKG